MNRKAQYSLLYEVVGLMVFGLVALIWFGGIETIIGGLTGDNAINSFNKVTSAISDQCRGLTGRRGTLVTGLDLSSLGNTFIITQLTVPSEFRNDPETMGFIQPKMRKCIGANCLCLLELRENEGNWLNCVTSDFDSTNLLLGGYLGPPGCPFWYYAPPSITEQAVQGVLDMLMLDIFDVLLAFLIEEQDVDEHYVFPAPELFGGCSGATEENLRLSNFFRESSTPDCDSISVPFYSYFTNGRNVISSFESMMDVDSPTTSFMTSASASDTLDKAVNDSLIERVSEIVPSKINNEFESVISPLVKEDFSSVLFNRLDQKLSIELNGGDEGVFGNFFDSLIEGFSQRFQGKIINVPEGKKRECVNEMINSVEDSLETVYYSQDISVTGTSEFELRDNKMGRLSFEVPDLLENLESIDLIFKARRGELDCALSSGIITCGENECTVDSGSVTDCDLDIDCSLDNNGNPVCYSTNSRMSVMSDTCTRTQIINTDSMSEYTFSFEPDCFTSNEEVIFYETSQDNHHSIKVSASNSPSTDIESEVFLTDSWNTFTNDWVIDIIFDEALINDQLTNYAVRTLTDNVIDKTFEESFADESVSCTLTNSEFSCSGAGYSLTCPKEVSINCDVINCVEDESGVYCDDGLTCSKSGDSLVNCIKSFSLKTYQLNSKDALAGISFSTIPEESYVNLSNFYFGAPGTGLITDLLEETLFNKDYVNCSAGYGNCVLFDPSTMNPTTASCESGDTCMRPVCDQAINPDKVISNSLPNSISNLKNEIRFSVSDSISAASLSNLDLTLVDPVNLETNYNINLSSESFSRTLAQEQYYYLRDSLLDCLSGELTVSDPNSDQVNLITDGSLQDMIIELKPALIESYASAINESLTSDSDGIKQSLNDVVTQKSSTIKNDLPDEILFNQLVSDELEETGVSIGEQMVSQYLGNITEGISEIRQSIQSVIDQKIEESYPEGEAPSIDCWPRIDGSYFEASPYINDLLSWRRYISVARLQPMVAAFTVDALGRVANLAAESASRHIMKRRVRSTIESTEGIDIGTSEEVFNENIALGISDNPPPSLSKFEGKHVSNTANELSENQRYLAELQEELSEVNTGLEGATGKLRSDLETKKFIVEDSISEAQEISSNLQSELEKYASRPFTGGFIFTPGPIGSSVTEVSSITGRVFSFKSVLSYGFKKTGKEVGEETIKKAARKLLIEQILLKGIQVAINIGINFWKNSIINKFYAEEVLYYAGGIRTFDHDKIGVRACIRMDELGCDEGDALWVNESFFCQTDLYVKRLINPNTWVTYLKGKDKCENAMHSNEVCLENYEQCVEERNEEACETVGVNPDAAPTGQSICYRNTFSACYKLSCNKTRNNNDRYHVFQYWVGAKGDPSNILGSNYGNVEALLITNASHPGHPWHNQVMIRVLGGDEALGIPASIV